MPFLNACDYGSLHNYPNIISVSFSLHAVYAVVLSCQWSFVRWPCLGREAMPKSARRWALPLWSLASFVWVVSGEMVASKTSMHQRFTCTPLASDFIAHSFIELCLGSIHLARDVVLPLASPLADLQLLNWHCSIDQHPRCCSGLSAAWQTYLSSTTLLHLVEKIFDEWVYPVKIHLSFFFVVPFSA